MGGLGWSNSSCLQIFFHKSGAGAQLLGVQWVQFGDFWYERVFKVYSVIKILVGRKGVEHLFSKYIGVFGVLGGEDYVVLVGSDSKLSREGGFSDMLIIE